MMTEMHLTS
ncbi:hypothetical protein PR048_012854 [Dryococelus australis]|uniref:Uncharacterized protein n=1 Tax=Dryococelus australis TaxID=614101 RepID=A0ABQ9HQY4_9NEOP|nr:hypothetical protein PR048_012854 [Dryococelus australis]